MLSKDFSLAYSFSLLVQKTIKENQRTFDKLAMHELMDKVKKDFDIPSWIGYTNYDILTFKNNKLITFNLDKYCKKRYFEYFIKINNNVFIIHFDKLNADIILFKSIEVKSNFDIESKKEILIKSNFLLIRDLKTNYNPNRIDTYEMQDCLVIHKISNF